jgi:hypothetical protein
MTPEGLVLAISARIYDPIVGAAIASLIALVAGLQHTPMNRCQFGGATGVEPPGGCRLRYPASQFARTAAEKVYEAGRRGRVTPGR